MSPGGQRPPAPRRPARSERLPGPRPRKALGQHFLRDTGVLADIASAMGPPGTLVVEIGAGTGQLTSALLDAGHEVLAVEIEPRLVRHLLKRFGDIPRLRVIQADAREIDLGQLVDPGRPFVVAGNLPYFAASYIVRRLLESERRPGEIVVMVQREVAREFAAKPGHLSLLAISVLIYAEALILFDVPPEAFDPPPNVWSSVVRLRVRPEPLIPRELTGEFFAFVSRVCRHPRKQIHNALGMPGDQADAALAAAEVERSRRPETLSIDEWLALLQATRGTGEGA